MWKNLKVNPFLYQNSRFSAKFNTTFSKFSENLTVQNFMKFWSFWEFLKSDPIFISILHLKKGVIFISDGWICDPNQRHVPVWLFFSGGGAEKGFLVSIEMHEFWLSTMSRREIIVITCIRRGNFFTYRCESVRIGTHASDSHPMRESWQPCIFNGSGERYFAVIWNGR